MIIFKGESRSANCTQSGSVPLFFAVFILPLVFLLLSLSLDLSSYFAEAQKIQNALDDAALYAYRLLPYQKVAQQAAQDYLARIGGIDAEISATVNLDSLEVEATKSMPLSFGGLAGSSIFSIPISGIARVRGAPVDAFIALDTGAELAPEIVHGAPWGQETIWPAAHYFDQPVFKPIDVDLEPRLLTQQCFNPTFSALKRAAIETFDYLGGFSLNAVGLGFFGENNTGPIEVARSVRDLPSLPSASQPWGEAAFISTSRLWVSEVDCAAVAEREIAYEVPKFSRALSPRGNWTNRPTAMVTPGFRSINLEYLPFLQSREVIWAQLVRDTRTQSTSGVLERVVNELLTAGVISARRGLQGVPQKVGVVLSGTFPLEAGTEFPAPASEAVLRAALRKRIFPSVLAAQTESAVRIVYVMLRPKPQSTDATDATALQRIFDEERDAAGLSPKRFKSYVFAARSPEDLLIQISPIITLLSRTAVVAS